MAYANDVNYMLEQCLILFYQYFKRNTLIHLDVYNAYLGMDFDTVQYVSMTRYKSL